eukprot:CAMPEP_0113725912 /NCGR_PEP_ID=MMETSP0038_2-20120614/40078_1 /TAXON_ID=2898 /ORGANISM="Cryptomonas paramecium" /LENGTH=172 /DNA_ID=CAMNT_0000656337 /DNA_START=59 /DNA_END=574 /DNA_ORIENTATION=+ /assembly_acc=CAM_ASM_000170
MACEHNGYDLLPQQEGREDCGVDCDESESSGVQELAHDQLSSADTPEPERVMKRRGIMQWFLKTLDDWVQKCADVSSSTELEGPVWATRSAALLIQAGDAADEVCEMGSQLVCAAGSTAMKGAEFAYMRTKIVTVCAATLAARATLLTGAISFRLGRLYIRAVGAAAVATAA